MSTEERRRMSPTALAEILGSKRVLAGVAGIGLAVLSGNVLLIGAVILVGIIALGVKLGNDLSR